ncbi:MAG: hypothetical protein JWQ40_1370 [Segetibacter sp.]|nr:hypothetical protein [Segetibacter sp.]
MKVPAQTAEIFETLSKGQFICSNSVHDENRKLYNIVDDNFEELYDYFEAIGFVLDKGDEYFYFTRKETKADLERKLEQAYKWIDILDFFKTYNNSFGPGYRFSADEILVQLKIDANLKDKLEQLKKPIGEGSHRERVQRLIDELAKFGMVELENEISQQYKVLSAFKYIEQLIVSIHITEEVQHEISQ